MESSFNLLFGIILGIQGLLVLTAVILLVPQSRAKTSMWIVGLLSTTIIVSLVGYFFRGSAFSEQLKSVRPSERGFEIVLATPGIKSEQFVRDGKTYRSDLSSSNYRITGDFLAPFTYNESDLVSIINTEGPQLDIDIVSHTFNVVSSENKRIQLAFHGPEIRTRILPDSSGSQVQPGFASFLLWEDDKADSIRSTLNNRVLLFYADGSHRVIHFKGRSDGIVPLQITLKSDYTYDTGETSYHWFKSVGERQVFSRTVFGLEYDQHDGLGELVVGGKDGIGDISILTPTDVETRADRFIIASFPRYGGITVLNRGNLMTFFPPLEHVRNRPVVGGGGSKLDSVSFN